MIAKVLYTILAVAVIGGYAYAGIRGAELPRGEKGFAPKGRGAQGGSRVFWYGGYRGGK